MARPPFSTSYCGTFTRRGCAAGLRDVVIAAGHAAEALRERVASLRRRHGVELEIVHNDRAMVWNNAYSLGGACTIRRSAFEQAGGYPGRFFSAHEETGLAWRLIDAGCRIEYDALAEMFHPALPPGGHLRFYRFNARNRVLAARRNLPWLLAGLYLLNWVALMLVRERSARALRPWFGGFAEGWRADPGRRKPVSWRTVWRTAAAGRPPLIQGTAPVI